MTEKKKPHLFKTFKGQLLVFLLLWSSCQTMSYYLVTENYRKAKKIREHYVNSEARIVGIDAHSFTFPEGETVSIKYGSKEKRIPALFFSYKTMKPLSGEYISINTYIKTKNLSFSLDSTLIGSSFNVICSSISPDLVMDEGQYLLSLTEKHIKKIYEGLKSFAIIWGIILAVLWLIGWIIFKVTDEQVLMIPEKDGRSFKVKFGLAQEPNDWDEDL